MADQSKTKDYILNATGQTVVRYADDGRVTFRKRYSKGDVIPLTDLEAEPLLRSGGILEKSDKDLLGTDEAPSPVQGTDPDTGVRLSDTSTVGRTSGTPDATQRSGVDFREEVAKARGEEFDESEYDASVDPADAPVERNEDFESMDYARLQRLAKDRTGNGGGSKEDLIARLEVHAQKAQSQKASSSESE